MGGGVGGGARFPLRFSGPGVVLPLLGLTRGGSYVEVTDAEVVVRMTWGFGATVPRGAVRSASPDHQAVWGWGVHGWRGVWLVNGSSSGLVRLELDPPGRGRVVGVPVRLRVLRVSVEDPDGLLGALAPR